MRPKPWKVGFRGTPTPPPQTENERLRNLGMTQKAAASTMRSEWGRTAEMCRRLLHKMEEQPARYGMAECLTVQVAIATICDVGTRASEKQRAAQDVARLFGSYRDKSKRDDPFREDESKISEEQKQVEQATTKDLLKVARKALIEGEEPVNAEGTAAH